MPRFHSQPPGEAIPRPAARRPPPSQQRPQLTTPPRPVLRVRRTSPSKSPLLGSSGVDGGGGRPGSGGGSLGGHMGSGGRPGSGGSLSRIASDESMSRCVTIERELADLDQARLPAYAQKEALVVFS